MTGLLTWLGVGLGGGAGAVARLLVDRAVAARVPAHVPAGILVVNVTGAVLLGLLTGVTADRDALLVLGAGVLGGYTTFSTWMVDTRVLTATGRARLAAANVVASALLGLLAVALGRALAGG